MHSDMMESENPCAYWKKPGTQKKWVLYDPICIRCELIYKDKKQNSAGLGP